MENSHIGERDRDVALPYIGTADCGRSNTDQLPTRRQVFTIRSAQMQAYVREALEMLSPSERIAEPGCTYSFRLQREPEYLVVSQYRSGKLVLEGSNGPLFRRAVEIVVRGYHRQYPKSESNGGSAATLRGKNAPSASLSRRKVVS